MIHCTGAKPTGGKLDRTSYLLGEDQTLNRSEQAYGPMFLRIDDIAIKDKEDRRKNRSRVMMLDNGTLGGTTTDCRTPSANRLPA